MREIAFDTETTGLNPNDGHRLVEIGCVELLNKVETGREFHRYLNPDRHMPSDAEAVHGLTIHFLSDKPRFSEIVADLLDFIGDSPLVAHNAHFDFGFLNWELAACGYDPICLSRMIDTLALARTRHPGAKHSLDALCTRFGVDRSQRIKHGALLDAQLLSQVYVELSGGRQIGFSLAREVGELASEKSPTIMVSRPVRAPRPHVASEEELARHAAFIAKLDNPLWAELASAA